MDGPQASGRSAQAAVAHDASCRPQFHHNHRHRRRRVRPRVPVSPSGCDGAHQRSLHARGIRTTAPLGSSARARRRIARNAAADRAVRQRRVAGWLPITLRSAGDQHRLCCRGSPDIRDHQAGHRQPGDCRGRRAARSRDRATDLQLSEDRCLCSRDSAALAVCRSAVNPTRGGAGTGNRPGVLSPTRPWSLPGTDRGGRDGDATRPLAPCGRTPDRRPRGDMCAVCRAVLCLRRNLRQRVGLRDRSSSVLRA